MSVLELLLSKKKYRVQKSIVPQKNKIWSSIEVILLICMLSLPTNKLSAQANDDCLACHNDPKMTMEKNKKEVSIFVDEKVLANSPHRKLSCVSCHVGFNPEEIPHKENIRPIDCRMCHKDAPLKHQFHPQMMKGSGIAGSIDVNCKHCHGTHDVVSPKQKNSKFNQLNLTQTCGSCHTSNKDKFLTSSHYLAFEQKKPGAPNCITCHKNPGIISGKGRDTLSVKVAEQALCLSCHLDDPQIRARTSPTAGFITSFQNSVHGIALSKGNAQAASCVDCHTSHEVNGPLNSASTINKNNIPQTCGKCHAAITEEYTQSVHGQSVIKGNKDAPVCTDCHGEHNILRTDDPQSPVAYQNVSEQVCAPCHESVRLTEKYGISSNRVRTFEKSYHGLAFKGGALTVANCASCHGVHNIKKSTDSTSTTHVKNLVHTCGTCHPGANENFTKGKIHVSEEKADSPILYYIATVYVILIVLTIGFMFFHNFIDFIKKAKIKKMKQRGLIPEEKHGHSLYLRMTLNERIQHISLALSFIVLVITGFMLRFPETWWVRHIRDLSENAFIYRSNLHRIAAVVMVAASLFHIYYVIFTQRGRQLIKDLLPVYKDLKDAIGIARFNLGLSKEKPKLDRFSYVEKAEYWALIWGTIVMTLTGIIMWFDNTFIGIFTKLGWDIARTIHYYEAWLAFLSIVVWHFYFVIFNPDVYPMSIAWLKGTITEEEMAEEHPLELDRIKKQKEE